MSSAADKSTNRDEMAQHHTLACSAGGISKGDLRRFLKWSAVHLGYASLSAVEAAPPTAELEPIREGTAAQTDEQDMGMTYEVQFPRQRQGQG
jgi:hypothetical protein